MSDGDLPAIPATRQAAAIPGRSRRGVGTVPGLQIVIVNGTSTPKIIGPAPFPAPAAIPQQPADHKPGYRAMKEAAN
jgi:hypothetical protein